MSRAQVVVVGLSLVLLVVVLVGMASSKVASEVQDSTPSSWPVRDGDDVAVTPRVLR